MENPCQSSVFVNPSRTIKSAVESLESSYFPVRRFGSGSFGKISPTFMKSWCSCQNNSNGLQRLNMVRLAFQRPKLSIYNYVYLLLSSSVLAPFAKCTIFFVTFFFVLSSLLPRLFRVLFISL
jgi:hypothetical protein